MAPGDDDAGGAAFDVGLGDFDGVPAGGKFDDLRVADPAAEFVAEGLGDEFAIDGERAGVHGGEGEIDGDGLVNFELGGVTEHDVPLLAERVVGEEDFRDEGGTQGIGTIEEFIEGGGFLAAGNGREFEDFGVDATLDVEGFRGASPAPPALGLPHQT